MTKSDESWSNKLRQIGDIERPDHSYLTPEHTCYFFGEYTARKGWQHSATNGIINNLKKSPKTRETWQWKYKARAIRQVGQLICDNLKLDALSQVTLVPAPPSKPPDHPDYDDRILRLANAISKKLDARSLLETTHAREPAHQSEDRPGPDALAAGIRFCEEQVAGNQVGTQIILLDDVLVTGATFVACRRILLSRFPNATVFGVFVARRVPEGALPEDDFDDWDF